MVKILGLTQTGKNEPVEGLMKLRGHSSVSVSTRTIGVELITHSRNKSSSK